jgi:hypothetical protein
MKYGKEIAGIVGLVVLVVAVTVWIKSSTSNIDTSGSKPPQTITQADYQNQIQAIQNTPNMPDNVKQMLEARIKSQMNGGHTPRKSAKIFTRAHIRHLNQCSEIRSIDHCHIIPGSRDCEPQFRFQAKQEN